MSGNVLIALFAKYVSEVPVLRDERGDLSDLAFNREYGLRIGVPEHWTELLDTAILHVVQSVRNNGVERVLFIYPSTRVYNKFSKELDAEYVGWHEIYTGMCRADRDARLLQRITKSLRHAGLVIFLGAKDAPDEVVDLVRLHTQASLIIVD